MRICPLPDLELEQLFVKIRFFILINLDKLAASPALNYFLSTLSLQCFINEYIYFESKEETKLVSELEALITESMKQSKQPELKTSVLVLINFINTNGSLEVLILDDIENIGRRTTCREQYKRHSYFGEISDNVSNKVRAVRMPIKMDNSRHSKEHQWQLCSNANLALFRNIKT